MIFFSIVAGDVFDFVYCCRLNIFTSKISDLLLPLEDEGNGGREFFQPNGITNKYIYDAFLMIYLSILLLLFLKSLVLQRS